MPKFLTPAETAKLLGKTPQTLASWRCNKRYELPYVKLGGNIRYDEKDVLAFIEQSRRAR